MRELYEKMINEAMAAQRADVDTVKARRGQKFVIEDTKPYVNVARKMTAIGDQSQAVIDLHKNSVISHYEILKGLTETVRPEDDPFVEHYQTPVVLEILKSQDEAFAKSVDTFIRAIADAEALIGLEGVRHYGGFYGPTCVVDFALMPGSTSNVVNRVLKKTDIPVEHKRAILAAKSWGMNTSYGSGDAFTQALEAGATPAEATAREIEIMQKIYREPVEAQAELMDDAGMTSFDARKYMSEYRRRIEASVKAAIEDGVHYGNILTVPAYSVGDVSHHIAQSTYNMCKDDIVMAVIEAVTEVMESTLRNSLDAYENYWDVLSLATGASAAATEYLLELDAFNAPMIVDLLTKRFHNYVQVYPDRGAAVELHNCDFMDMIYRGWKLLDKAHRNRNGSDEELVPMVGRYPVDLSPIHRNEVLMNPQWYTYPACAISVRFSALMRLADYPCLLTSEPVTATMMTNIIALEKETVAAPVRACKNCAAATLVDLRHPYCQWKEAI
ncbi:MAG TPA: DUF2193 domain-containing protein [Candidatus Methanoculleus thermohydrogenotrophicum]|jgi:hypothetical protein|nr:DUF2193 domain-containing protein [Candidatus Methanoculleus thermohydrogenotrophicum]NLM82057.1 DUF2193 domain-containing protein [Candidatus Methanoculleus thermohydrogenotrophicum]HOB17251.1 DUF2193 domain-containing protein [Candidatus Methanoculleus thermohydrogenotrophicum]HPZ37464.1 DUF2193 domain-containing protein [Candidatus Methanoculleus thermohydrogenotrophicum]HQC90859.1 DUF2193 domain-containing protein [Candidatus Methanoculleus thermohydrogenotrophicum]